MFQHQVYQCPKCYNTLLVSNKMLHDLRCTVENPATYENILFRQSQLMSNDSSYYNNYNNPYNTNSSQRFSSRTSIKNDDGTTVDIVKEKNIEDQDQDHVQDQKRNPTHREKNANIIETILLRIDQPIQINQTETKLSTRQ